MVHGNMDLIYTPRKKALRTYKGPDCFLPGNGSLTVWGLMHEFPNYAKIMVYLFVNQHIQHYIEQYQKADLAIVKKALNNRGDSTTFQDLLHHEAKMMLTDEKPGPAAMMFIAGCLKKEIIIHYEDGLTDFLCPCPCVEEEVEVVHLYQDRGENVYPLSPKEMWSDARHSTRKKETEEKNIQNESNDGNKGCLLGMEKDGIVFQRYGYAVWKGDINRLARGQWLDDSIVYVTMRYHQDQIRDQKNIHIFDPTFSRMLLAPTNSADDGSRLRLHYCNIEAVQAFSRRVDFNEKRLLLFPICDNLHWILAAYIPETKTLMMLCSMGGKYPKTAECLRRYLSVMTKEDGITVTHPTVDKQTNGNDCGVFVVSFAECLIKKEDPLKWKVKSRVLLLKTIKKMY